MKEQQIAEIFEKEIGNAEQRWDNVSFAKLSQIAKRFMLLGVNSEREYLFNSENTLDAKVVKYKNLYCFEPKDIDEWNAFLERFKVGTKVKIIFIENE